MEANRAHESSNGLYMTVEQYLALDESSDAKYEYLDGYAYLLRPPSSVYDDRAVLDLARGSPTHAALCARIIALLENALSDGPCMPYTSDAKVKLDERRYFYPDVTVACGEQDEQMLKNPVVVIEVLSPSTEKRDRGAKFKAYKRLPSLQEYVLIGSESKSIEVYRREGAFWKQYDYQEGDMIELISIGVRFSFERVYHGVRIP
jgi:Uma2 family endonuclease